MLLRLCSFPAFQFLSLKQRINNIMSTRLVLMRRQQTNLLLRFLIKNPSTSTLLHFSSSPFLRFLSTLPSKESSLPPPPLPTVITDLHKQLRNILYREVDDNKKKEQLLKLFSSTTTPRLPQSFSEEWDDYSQIETYNNTLKLLYECDQVQYARELLDEMFEHDWIICGTKEVVFDGFVKRISRGEPVKKEYMIEVVDKFCDGYPPVSTITPLIIKLCTTGHVTHVDTAWDLVHVVIKRAGYICDIECVDALLDGLGRENKVEKMKLLLSETQEMSGYRIVEHHLCRLEKVNEALQVVEEAFKNGWHDEVLTLVNRLRSEHDYAPNDVIYNALIDGLCKVGEITKSRILFDQMKEEGIVPTVVTYAAIIHGYCKEKKIKEILLLMGDMKVNGVIADVGTYNAIFQVLREMKCLDNAFKLLENMKEQACYPNDVTMDILTSWFSTEGKTERLRNFVQDI